MLVSQDLPSPVWRVVLWVGVFIVLHSAYLFVHYKNLMKSLGNLKDASTLPLDVQVELSVGFFLSLMGSVGWSGTLRKAKVTEIVSNKDFDVYDNREDFMTFNHRGKALTQRRAAKN